MRIQQIAGAATAFLFAGLAPALVMAALWHMAKIAPIIFAFTFAIALGHAVLFGLPLFLVLRSRGWINVMSCVIFGFAIGAVPIGVLTWPTQHPELHTLASVWRADDHQRGHHGRWMGQLRQTSDLFRLVRGSRRIRLLGRSDMVRHPRKSRRGHRSFTSFWRRALASSEERGTGSLVGVLLKRRERALRNPGQLRASPRLTLRLYITARCCRSALPYSPP